VLNGIIVAVDLASNVDRALPVARALGRLGNLPIQLLTVSDWMSDGTQAGEMERLARDHGISPLACVVDRDDDPARAIARHVNNSEGSLLVMAASARPPHRLHSIGTVSAGVLAQVNQPVLLVGPGAGECRLESPTLITCIDEHDTADAALPVIAQWIETFGGGQPWCAEVVPPAAGNASRVRASSRLRDYATQLAQHRIASSCKVLNGGDPVSRLEGFADTVNDAVFVASSARWTDWSPDPNSVTRRMVHTAARPVLVVPARLRTKAAATAASTAPPDSAAGDARAALIAGGTPRDWPRSGPVPTLTPAPGSSPTDTLSLSANH
jgi:nucleotide-binding universal stress UspA family protein